MKPKLLITEDGVALGFYENHKLVSLKVEGRAGEIIFPLEGWRKMMSAWQDFDKQLREDVIDRRIFKDRPDGW